MSFPFPIFDLSTDHLSACSISISYFQDWCSDSISTNKLEGISFRKVNWGKMLEFVISANELNNFKNYDTV